MMKSTLATMLSLLALSNCFAASFHCPASITCEGDSVESCIVDTNKFIQAYSKEGLYTPGDYYFVAAGVYEVSEEQSKFDCLYNNGKAFIAVEANKLLNIDYDYLSNKYIWFWQANREGVRDGKCYHSALRCDIKMN